MSRKKRVTRPLQDKPLADVKKVADLESGAGFEPFPEAKSEPSTPLEMPEKFEGPAPSGMPEKFEQAAPEPEVVYAEDSGPYEARDSGVYDRHGNRCAIGGFDHNREQSGPAYAHLIADALNAFSR